MTRAAPTAEIDLRLREVSRSRERYRIAFNKLRTPPSRLLAGSRKFSPLPDVARDSSCLSVAYRTYFFLQFDCSYVARCHDLHDFSSS